MFSMNCNIMYPTHQDCLVDIVFYFFLNIWTHYLIILIKKYLLKVFSDVYLLRLLYVFL